MTITAAPDPTRCYECGRRTETWIVVYISDLDRAPVCLDCAPRLGWAPLGALVALAGSGDTQKGQDEVRAASPSPDALAWQHGDEHPVGAAAQDSVRVSPGPSRATRMQASVSFSFGKQRGEA